MPKRTPADRGPRVPQRDGASRPQLLDQGAPVRRPAGTSVHVIRRRTASVRRFGFMRLADCTRIWVRSVALNLREPVGVSASPRR